MLKQILKLERNDPKLLGALFAYLFGHISKAEYKEAIGDKEEAKRLWTATSCSGYILKNCKLFAYAVHVNRKQGIATSPAKFGIYKEDVPILRRLNLNHIKGYKAYSLFDFDNLEGSILKSTEIKNYTGKFISKKMSYLMKSYGQSREELFGQMQHAALYALRKSYPCYESDLHALNICKTAIHNSGVGIMEYWNRAKRKALILDQGVFQAVKVPFESLADVGVDPEHNSEYRLNIQSLVSISERLKPQAQKFMSAAAGLYDPGFSLFIGIDNREAAESWAYDRYLSNLRGYYSVTEQQTQKLFQHLRKSLT
jgi:hypothetical protein